MYYIASLPSFVSIILFKLTVLAIIILLIMIASICTLTIKWIRDQKEEKFKIQYKEKREQMEKEIKKCDSSEKSSYIIEKQIRENGKLIKDKEKGLDDAKNTISNITSAILGIVLSLIFTSDTSNPNGILFYISENYFQLLLKLVISTLIIIGMVFSRLGVDKLLESVDKNIIKALIVENEKLYEEKMNIKNK